MEIRAAKNKKSSTCEQTPKQYYDENQDAITREEWIADRLLITYAAMDKAAPTGMAIATMATDLGAELSDEQLLKGLSRLRKEREWISVKAIMELSGAASEDGRPEVEAAWSMCPRSEDQSVVWTAEMAEAFDFCRAMLNAGDEIAARMVFKEQYPQLISRARANHVPVRWTVSLGWNVDDRVRALSEAVQKNRIKAQDALGLLGPAQQDVLLQQLPAPARKQLVGETKPNLDQLSGLQKTLHSLSESHLMPKELQSAAAAPVETKSSVLDDPEKMDAARKRVKNLLRQRYPERFVEAVAEP